MRRSLLILGLSLFAIRGSAAAQSPGTGVVGSVVSSDGGALSAAVVELRTRSDTASLGSTLSRPDGRFQLANIPPGTYHLRIGILGFGDAETDDFTVVAGQIRNLGPIELAVEALALEPVLVRVERPDVVFEADRTGYLVDAIAGAAGGAITDALRSIPDLDVDIDGNVQLRGGTPAIYIDGRPAPMDGVSLSVFLEQFPADQIERIEVIDVPPARYRAEGSAGIVNIVLKEGAELGLSGNVSVAAGTRGEWTGSGRATLQRGPWTLNGGLNTRLSDSQSFDFTLRENLLADPITYLQQDAESQRSTQSVGGRVEIRREIAENGRLWTRLSVDANGSDRSGVTSTAHLAEGQIPTLEYDRVAVTEDNDGSREFEAGFSWQWEPDEHELEIQANFEHDRNDQAVRDEIQTSADFEDDDLLPAWLTVRDEGSREDALTLELDYVRPLSQEIRLEVGGELERQTNAEDQVTSRFALPGAPTPDEEAVYSVSREQTVQSGYATLQRQIGPVGLQAGLRGEWVNENLGLSSGAVLDQREFDLFPSVNATGSIGRGRRVRLGYSQRIGRPRIDLLDPTDRSTDPLNRIVGNPDLDASRTHNVVGNLTFSTGFGALNVGSYWNLTSNGWERITTVDADGISTRTWANLTSRTQAGSSLNLMFPSVRGWRGRMNVSGGYSSIEGSVRGNQVTDGQWIWSTRGNIDGPLLPDLSIQTSFGYRPSSNLAQGRTSGEWQADFGFRYRLLDDRASLRLSVRDPFLLEQSREEIRDPSVIQTNRTTVTSRRLTLLFSYAFRQGPSVEGGRGPSGRGGGRGGRRP